MSAGIIEDKCMVWEAGHHIQHHQGEQVQGHAAGKGEWQWYLTTVGLL